jgi:hypothetical protein
MPAARKMKSRSGEVIPETENSNLTQLFEKRIELLETNLNIKLNQFMDWIKSMGLERIPDLHAQLATKVANLQTTTHSEISTMREEMLTLGPTQRDLAGNAAQFQTVHHGQIAKKIKQALTRSANPEPSPPQPSRPQLPQPTPPTSILPPTLEVQLPPKRLSYLEMARNATTKEESLQILLKKSKPDQLVQEVASLIVEIPLSAKVTQTPTQSLKAFSLAFQRISEVKPLMISPYHPGKAQVFIHRNQYLSVQDKFKESPDCKVTVDHLASERDTTRLARSYLNSYCTPIRSAILTGLNPALIFKILDAAEIQLSKRTLSQYNRSLWKHLIQLDRRINPLPTPLTE